MTEEEIIALIKQLEDPEIPDHYSVWSKIRDLDIDRPAYFLKVYPTVKHWKDRVFLVYKSIPFARRNESAFQLGIQGLNDRATMVRHHATAILAYSLRPDAIPYLEKNLSHKDSETRKDAQRAIRAIKNMNHHLFMEHRRNEWVVNTMTDRKRERSTENTKPEKVEPEFEENRFLRMWKSLLRW